MRIEWLSITFQKLTLNKNYDMKNYAEQFKENNSGKWIWFNGAMGLDTAISNDYITDTREEAVKAMAWRDEVSIEDVENNHNDWYYIIEVDELEDDAINNYFENL